MRVDDAAHPVLRRDLPAGAAGHLRPHVALLLALLAALLLLAGCGPLPRPFEPEDKTANPLLPPIEGQELMVLPIQGAAPALPDGGATIIAEALKSTGLPAHAGPRTAQSRLALGTAAITPLADGNERLTLSWEIYAPGGSLLWTYPPQELTLPAGLWKAGDPDTLRFVGLKAAPILEAAVKGPELVAAVGDTPKTAQGERVPIVVTGMKTAPGDGSHSLPRALSSVLTQRGFLVTESPKPEGFVVEGSITITAVSDTQDKVVLTWRVLQGDGTFLGNVEQANVIPKGTLSGRWGDIAAIIAVGAADGIQQLLRKAGKI